MLKNNICENDNIIKAEVVSIDNRNNIILQVDNTQIDTACKNCTSSCLMATKQKTIKLHTHNKYNIGDIITLKIDDKYRLKLSFVLYGLPITFMIMIAFIIDKLFHKELYTILATILALFISWLILKYISKNITKSPIKIIG